MADKTTVLMKKILRLESKVGRLAAKLQRLERARDDLGTDLAHTLGEAFKEAVPQIPDLANLEAMLSRFQTMPTTDELAFAASHRMQADLQKLCAIIDRCLDMVGAKTRIRSVDDSQDLAL